MFLRDDNNVGVRMAFIEMLGKHQFSFVAKDCCFISKGSSHES